MASRLFDWGCWQKLLVGTGICRVPTCIGGTSTVVATERHFGIKTHSSGGATPDRPTSDGPEGSSYSSSEDRLFQLRRAEKMCVVVANGGHFDKRVAGSVTYNHACYVYVRTLTVRMFLCTLYSVAVFAGISLLVGYVALKSSFSGRWGIRKHNINYVFLLHAILFNTADTM